MYPGMQVGTGRKQSDSSDSFQGSVFSLTSCDSLEYQSESEGHQKQNHALGFRKQTVYAEPFAKPVLPCVSICHSLESLEILCAHSYAGYEDAEKHCKENDVFLSHRGGDEDYKNTCIDFMECLERVGLRAFLDKALLCEDGGQLKNQEKIFCAIEHCKVFVAFISPSFYTSIYPIAELIWARRRGKKIFTIFTSARIAKLPFEEISDKCPLTEQAFTSLQNFLSERFYHVCQANVSWKPHYATLIHNLIHQPDKPLTEFDITRLLERGSKSVAEAEVLQTLRRARGLDSENISQEMIKHSVLPHREKWCNINGMWLCCDTTCRENNICKEPSVSDIRHAEAHFEKMENILKVPSLETPDLDSAIRVMQSIGTIKKIELATGKFKCKVQHWINQPIHFQGKGGADFTTIEGRFNFVGVEASISACTLKSHIIADNYAVVKLEDCDVDLEKGLLRSSGEGSLILTNCQVTT